MASLKFEDKDLIKRLCKARWLRGEKLREDLPGHWYNLLYCGHSWDNKKQLEYERVRKKAGKGAQARREDPNNPAWVHRLSLVYSGDDRLAVDARHLALLVRGESLSDFGGQEEADYRRREAYTEHLKGLRERWQHFMAALNSRRLPGYLEISGVVAMIQTTLARRYAAMKKAVGTRGSAATEVLANTARQYREVREYFERFGGQVNQHQVQRRRHRGTRHVQHVPIVRHQHRGAAKRARLVHFPALRGRGRQQWAGPTEGAATRWHRFPTWAHGIGVAGWEGMRVPRTVAIRNAYLKGRRPKHT